MSDTKRTFEDIINNIGIEPLDSHITEEAIPKMIRDTVVKPLEDMLCTAVCLLSLKEAFMYQVIRPEYYGDQKNFRTIHLHAADKLTKHLKNKLNDFDSKMIEPYKPIINDALSVANSMRVKLSKMEKENEHIQEEKTRD